MCCHSLLAVSNMPSRTLDLPVITGNNGRVFVEDLMTKILSFITQITQRVWFTHSGKSHSLEQIQENSPWGKVLTLSNFLWLRLAQGDASHQKLITSENSSTTCIPSISILPPNLKFVFLQIFQWRFYLFFLIFFTSLPWTVILLAATQSKDPEVLFILERLICWADK